MVDVTPVTHAAGGAVKLGNSVVDPGFMVDPGRNPGLAAEAVSASPAARVRGLRCAFDGRAVLDGVDLDIAPGEFVAMLGVSGTGKSTRLRALAGLDREVTGELAVPGPVAVAFQEPRLLPFKVAWSDFTSGPADAAGDGGRVGRGRRRGQRAAGVRRGRRQQDRDRRRIPSQPIGARAAGAEGVVDHLGDAAEGQADRGGAGGVRPTTTCSPC